jgi:hypothetical protein
MILPLIVVPVPSCGIIEGRMMRPTSCHHYGNDFCPLHGRQNARRYRAYSTTLLRGSFSSSMAAL